MGSVSLRKKACTYKQLQFGPPTADDWLEDEAVMDTLLLSLIAFSCVHLQAE